MSRPTDVQEGVENRFDTPSSICSLRPRPRIVTGILRRFLGNHFADPLNIEEPSLRDLVWVENTSNKAFNPASKILIESSLRYVADATDQRPAIIIHRGDWTLNPPVGMNSNLMQGGGAYGANDTRSQFYTGTHTLFCIAPGAECEVLGCEVYREIGQFAPELRKLPQFMAFRLTSIGSPQPLTKSLKEFVVPVTVTYQFQDTYELVPHLPKIKRFQTNYNIQCP